MAKPRIFVTADEFASLSQEEKDWYGPHKDGIHPLALESREHLPEGAKKPQVWEVRDTGGLHRALEDEKEALRKAKASQLPDGVDVAKLQADSEALAKLREESRSKDATTIPKSEHEAIVADLASQFTEKEASYKQQLTASDSSLEELLIDGEIRRLMNESEELKGNPERVIEHVRLHRKAVVYRDESTGARSVRVPRPDGEGYRISRKDSDGSHMGLSEALADLRSEGHAGLFTRAGINGPGDHNPGETGPPSGPVLDRHSKDFNLTRLGQQSKADPTLRDRVQRTGFVKNGNA